MIYKPLTESQFLSHFQSLGPRFVSGGDYNAKRPRWGSRLANPCGCLLNRIQNSQNLNFISPPSPAYWGSFPPTRFARFFRFFRPRVYPLLYQHPQRPILRQQYSLVNPYSHPNSYSRAYRLGEIPVSA